MSSRSGGPGATGELRCKQELSFSSREHTTRLDSRSPIPQKGVGNTNRFEANSDLGLRKKNREARLIITNVVKNDVFMDESDELGSSIQKKLCMRHERCRGNGWKIDTDVWKS